MRSHEIIEKFQENDYNTDNYDIVTNLCRIFDLIGMN